MTKVLAMIRPRAVVIATDVPEGYVHGDLAWVVMDEQEAAALVRRCDALRAVRARRDELLASSDWTQMQDAPLPPHESAAWRAYRKALRDLPATADADGHVTWPSRPDA